MLRKLGYAAVLIGALAAPFFLYPVLLMKIMCFALFACAFNLLIGFTGLLSFGHAAFFGGSAYIAGHALKVWGVPTEIGLVLGVLYAAIMGFVIGKLAIRRQGIYFTMITMALSQMVFFVFLQAPFTGGEDGLQSIPRGTFLGSIDLKNDLTMYYVVLGIVVLSFLLVVRIIHSPFGQVLKAVRENEPRAISLGYDTDRYKLLAFVLSAALAGLAGSTKAVVLGFGTLTDVHWSMSGLVVLMTLVGGMGTLFGPVVGAIIIIALENKLGDLGTWLAKISHIEWFNTIGESVTMVTGLIFVICVLAFRRGIIGELAARLR
jgi:branched-chain amino acid transport system permease protein